MSNPDPTRDPVPTPIVGTDAQVLSTGSEVDSRFVLSGTDDAPVVIRLLSEHLQAEKQWVQAGTVVLRKTVESEQQTVPVNLAYEEVHVERVAMNRVLAEGETAGPRQEGDTLIIPVIAEELVVIKRRVVHEELRIRKQRQSRQEVIQDVVRREELHLDTAGDIEVLPVEDNAS